MSDLSYFRVSVLGAGSWGTALATVLIENGHDVVLWSCEEEQIEEMRKTGRNAPFLPDHILPQTLILTSDLSKAVAHGDIICFVVPTNATREVAKAVMPLLNKRGKARPAPIIMHASKGLEQKTHLRVSQILAEVLAEANYHSIVALSGPSHAEEVVKHDLTAITAASENLEAAKIVQEVFMNDYFRVYTNSDIIGVEFGGALKNIIALGAGVLHGMGMGDNAKAGLITRGLVEITRLGAAFGADPLTFTGLSGVGDLIVTCTSPHSRNWRAGDQIGRGIPIATVEKNMGMVVEGIATTNAAYELAKEKNIEMPITEAIYAVIYEGESPKEAIMQLMQRERKGETQFSDAIALFNDAEKTDKIQKEW